MEREGCCLTPWLMSNSAGEAALCQGSQATCPKAWKESGQDSDIPGAASHSFSVENCFTQIIVTGTDEWKI